ncbi:MAG: Ig-like domain-containing protein, partial [Elusimicrobiota bacterium]
QEIKQPFEISKPTPSDSENVFGTVDIEADVESAAKITKVEFYINGSLNYVDTESPYSYSWDTTQESDGYHTIKAKAYDSDGRTTSDRIAVYIEPITVSVTSPSDEEVVSGNVEIQADAQAKTEIEKVEFFINDSLYWTDTSAPYYYPWDTTAESTGAYTIMAKAHDTDSRVSSHQVTVYIESVSITSPSDGEEVYGETDITVDVTSGIDVGKVEFYINDSLSSTTWSEPYSYAWDTTTESTGTHKIEAKVYYIDGHMVSEQISAEIIYSYTSGPSHGEGSGAFNGAAKADDGRIIFAPFDSDNIGIFDPSDNSYTSGPAHGEGSRAFNGAAKADDGRIIFAPFDSDNIGIFDPSDNSYTSGPAHGQGDLAFSGAAKADDGRIVFAPSISDNIGIFDPSDNSYTSGAVHGEGIYAFEGAVKDGDSRIVFAPYASDNIGIFDPSDNSYTSGPAHGEGSYAFRGAVKADNAHIIFVPYGSDNVGGFNHRYSEWYESVTAHEEGGGVFSGAAKADDGRIIFAPYRSDNVGIFDDFYESYISGPVHREGSGAFSGAAKADDGRIIFAPFNSDNVGILE